MSETSRAFTMEPLDWASWLPTIRLEEATPEQVAVLEESLPTAKTSPYYLLLARDVEVLRERSRLFNAVMYAPKGLARADREFATVVVSRINGCVYCASVHAIRFAQLTKHPEIPQAIFDRGLETEVAERYRAISDYAAKLTRTPARMAPEDLAPLRRVGLSDLEILDLTNAVAMFAWANRLMLTLGEPVAKNAAP